MSDILSLSGARARRKFEESADANNERVWGRTQRLCGILTSGGLNDTSQRIRFWNDAANALIQYLDNEFPVEKDSKCRADMVAEHAATLYASGIFDPVLSDKALKLQTALLDAIEPEDNDPVKNQFAAARRNYGLMVEKLIDARMSGAQVKPEEPTNNP